MTQISRDAVLKLASLSNIQLAEDEIDPLREDIQNILSYVEQLDELDTENVEPAYQVTGLSNVYRSDTIEHSVERESLLKLAPEQVDNQIKVPKVL
ncbi:MAG TPA: Asp-tRNA(Asn)/Glu-tRNA(Gln) amidotransferase subunit GatC [Candidatus Saccharibacteria bacterium]|nr:Asp-tRNA(Asn)/Glu-tRNA(Gln) amidotransferase subunit GatC [Candidatus Saccharibacteria bacterium]HRK94478.1 Asp-tRNA(Asn)/Glu-tRNA(Gln) amidotransferase subunit GatC [Candidatus Saccharibacteria bacterium]